MFHVNPLLTYSPKELPDIKGIQTQGKQLLFLIVIFLGQERHKLLFEVFHIIFYLWLTSFSLNKAPNKK